MKFKDKLFAAAVAVCIMSAAVTFTALVNYSKAHAATWHGPVQASHYTIAENGSQTASGIRMTNSSMCVAVPMNKVCSRTKWKRGSSYFKRTHFYYGEKLRLKKGSRTCTVRVADCGGFGRCGGYYKGKWRQRMFDLQPAVKRYLRCGGLSYIYWKVA